MRSFRKDAKIGALVLVAALVVAQAVRIEKTNPPEFSEISAAPEIQPLLRRACYDCHSNETVWPWYSNIAPVSWMVGSDVAEGRRMLNFSEWGRYANDNQGVKLSGIIKEMQDGDMPPWYYSAIHRNSRLNQQERERIKAWATVERNHVKPSKSIEIAGMLLHAGGDRR